MSSKEYLLKLLTKLYPLWSLAEPFKNIINNLEFDDSIFQLIIWALKYSIHESKIKVSIKKQKKMISFLEELKNIEQSQSKKDIKDIENLDKLLEDI